MEEKEEKQSSFEEEKKKKEELEKKLIECQKLRDEYLAGWQRSRADFLNYKKEELKRIAEVAEFTKRELVLKILEILDNLERAIEQVSEKEKDSEWTKGIIQIREQFRKFLSEEKVEEIKAEGERFNPDFHEAVDEIEVSGKESGYIVDVLEKGYLLNGQVLRPAKVRVSK